MNSNGRKAPPSFGWYKQNIDVLRCNEQDLQPLVLSTEIVVGTSKRIDNNRRLSTFSDNNRLHYEQNCYSKTNLNFYLINDIKFIAKNIKNITFTYYNRSTNSLGDKSSKKDPYYLLY